MSDNPEKCADYLKIVRLIVDVGTDTVRDLVYYYKAKNSLAAFFAGITISGELKSLKRKHVLSKEQYEKVITSPNADEFDLTLLITLLTNIFKYMLEEPLNGWDMKVDEHDNTIGSDLLRLKELRNTLVAHRPNARLSTEEFENLWGKLDNILTRIWKHVNGENEEYIKSKIEEYKSKKLDCDSEAEKYYKLLQYWNDEGKLALEKLQDEVEILTKKTEEFCLLFKSKIPDRYSRYVLLLYEGGYLVLTSTLLREIQRYRTDLKTLLKSSKHSLTEMQHDVIFKNTGEINVDVSTWGIPVLADVILTLFSYALTKLEKKATEGIKEASRSYARSALASIDSDKFRSYWTDLISDLNILSAGQDETTQTQCQILIKKHDRDVFDEDVVKRYLSELLVECRPLESLIGLYTETRKKLKETVEEMQKEGIGFAKEKELDLKMMTIGKTEEKRELAENILFTVWQQAVDMTDGSGDFPTVKEAVEKILGGINAIENVKVASVEKHCIILTMRCSTNTGFLDLLDVTRTESFIESFECISEYFSDYFGETITITAFFTLESMQVALDTLAAVDETGKGGNASGARLRLICSSADAIEDVRHMIEDDANTNYLNEIAKALSDHVDEDITIRTVLNMGGLGEIFGNPLRDLASSAWIQFLQTRDRCSRRVDRCSSSVLDTSSHLWHLKKLFEDVKRPPRRRLVDLRTEMRVISSSDKETSSSSDDKTTSSSDKETSSSSDDKTTSSSDEETSSSSHDKTSSSSSHDKTSSSSSDEETSSSSDDEEVRVINRRNRSRSHCSNEARSTSVVESIVDLSAGVSTDSSRSSSVSIY